MPVDAQVRNVLLQFNGHFHTDMHGCGLASKYGVRTVALTADATNATQVEASFAAAAAQLGTEPNVVVATVGGGGVTPGGGLVNSGTDMDGKTRTEHSHEESWETTMRILAVTQFSAHHCCKVGARHMIAGGRGGAIVVIGSCMAEFSHATSSTVRKQPRVPVEQLFVHRLIVTKV